MRNLSHIETLINKNIVHKTSNYLSQTGLLSVTLFALVRSFTLKLIVFQISHFLNAYLNEPFKALSCDLTACRRGAQKLTAVVVDENSEPRVHILPVMSQ